MELSAREKLKSTIGANIRALRYNKFPGVGGAKKCAESFGVSQQQWSPWECGKRLPTETKIAEIASFFGVSVSWLREDHAGSLGEVVNNSENCIGVFVELPKKDGIDSLKWGRLSAEEISDAICALCAEQKVILPSTLCAFIVENLRLRNQYEG